MLVQILYNFRPMTNPGSDELPIRRSASSFFYQAIFPLLPHAKKGRAPWALPSTLAQINLCRLILKNGIEQCCNETNSYD